MKKQTIAVLGPGSWGTALSQVLNDNGHEVRIWGNISDQIDEINNQHTNKRYFKDILLDEKIKAYHDLEETLKDVDAVLFVVPTKVRDWLPNKWQRCSITRLSSCMPPKDWNQIATNVYQLFLKRKSQLTFVVKSLLFQDLVTLRKPLYAISP